MDQLDKIMSYKRHPDDDFYAILGCAPSASTEQVLTEYKRLALQLHPDKQQQHLVNDSSQPVEDDRKKDLKFQLIQRAKDTLCDENERRLYDKWRLNGIGISFSDWRARKQMVETAMHWANPKQQPAIGCQASNQTQPAVGVGSSVWVRDQSDILQKFRTYQI